LTAVMDAGVNFFDNAYNYGKNGLSEKNLGLLMGTPRRKKVFLATKCESRTYDGAMKQVETSLKRLRVDSVDLIQVHHVCNKDNVKDFGKDTGVVSALRKLRDQKVVRFIGVTGHPQYPPVAEALELYDWDTFMGFINPSRHCRIVYEKQLPIALKKKMGVIAMKSLGGANYGKNATHDGLLVGDTEGKADAVSLLRWALSQPVTLTIPALYTLEQLRENLEAVRNFKPMSQADQKAVAARVNAPEKGKGWREK